MLGPLVALEITSPAFPQNGRIPAANTCDGTSGNPPLVFSGVPAGTKSLAIVVDDPDVPWILQRNHLFVHWVRWDLPPGTPGIAEGAATQGISNDGNPGYVDPCPPNGDHRYVFKLFALDTELGAGARITSADDLYKAMEAHTLARAELVGHYSRPISKLAVPLAIVTVAFVLVLGGLYAAYRGARGMLRAFRS